MEEYKTVVEKIIEEAGFNGLGNKTRERLATAICTAVHEIVDTPVQELHRIKKSLEEEQGELQAKYEEMFQELRDANKRVTETADRILHEKVSKITKIYELMKEAVENQRVKISFQEMFPEPVNQLFRMKYKCQCGCEWEQTHGCACNDRCPDCNTETKPYETEDCE